MKKSKRSRKPFKSILSLVMILAVSLGLLNADRLYYTRPTTPKELVKVSVMVVNSKMNSGGSGVILKSSSEGSQILTNSHVCEVVKEGGFVITANGKPHAVKAYKQSKIHDLCLVLVASNLHINTKVADTAPEAGDYAVVTGHPSLLPIIITEGHFSEKMIINVMIDIKKCTAADYKNPDTAEVCFMMGGIPITKRFEALVASNLIMPGSSGSPVFNADGEIAAVVFAGGGDLSFSFMVPQEYILKFVENESKLLKWSKPQKKAKSLAI